jgi:hypothetical protein
MRQVARRTIATPTACTPRPLTLRLLGNTPNRASQRTPKDCHAVCLPVVSQATHSSVDSCSATACLSTMVLGLASFPESLSSQSETATQPRRPSVKWDLGSDYRKGTEETTASGSNFRRERLDSQPDLGLHVQPQIYFLRPRSPLPKLLFRCGSGIQSSCQTRDPVRESDSLCSSRVPPPTSALRCSSDRSNVSDRRIFQTQANP